MTKDQMVNHCTAAQQRSCNIPLKDSHTANWSYVMKINKFPEIKVLTKNVYKTNLETLFIKKNLSTDLAQVNISIAYFCKLIYVVIIMLLLQV